MAIRRGYEDTASLSGVVAKLIPGKHLSPGQLDFSYAPVGPSGPPGHKTMTLILEHETRNAREDADRVIVDAEPDPGTTEDQLLQVVLNDQPADQTPDAKNATNERGEGVCWGDIVVPWFPSVQRKKPKEFWRWYYQRPALRNVPPYRSIELIVSAVVSAVVVTVIGVLSQFQPGTVSRPGWRAVAATWPVATCGYQVYIVATFVPLGFLCAIFESRN